jgi:hypothetical protein
MPHADEPSEENDPLEAPDEGDEDEGVAAVPSWLGAIGQMIAAVLVVVAVVALFIVAAAALRRLLP